MPLLRKETFVRKKPDKDLTENDKVFFCEATKEVFREYEEFFERTILCNSLVWSCAITGKANLTFEEALDSEAAARKRLGTIPRPLKKGILWLADRTQRGRISDLVDDVYVFASGRYFKGEIVEAIVADQWCDCRVINVIPPTQAEIDKDAELEREEQLKEEKEKEESPSKEKTSPSKAKKAKKSFFPPEHLFKYELEELEEEEEEDEESEDENGEKKEKKEKDTPIHTIDAEDIRREKGTYTREKNLLFLKNITELGKDGNFQIKKGVSEKYKVSEIQFTSLFAGAMPVFEITKRVKNAMPAFAAKKKDPSQAGKKAKGGQGTLDGWVKGEGGKNKKAPGSGDGKPANKVKKQTAAEVEAEMKRMREQNERFKEELRQRAEEDKKRKIEERAREKERKKEQAKLLKEVMNEWRKPRDDLDCEDLKMLPVPTPVRCRIPNKLFGDFLTLLEFFQCFKEVLEVNDSFGSGGITFDILERALTGEDDSRSETFEVVSFLLQALFDLQNEEDDEVKLDKESVADVNPNEIEKGILGRDEDIANQIKSATVMARWPIKHQGQSLCELHMNEWSITEILRLHLAASGGLRSEKSVMWLYQQRGGFRLSDDPGLGFRMEHPQVVEALATKSIYELSVDEKMKVLHCLMQQIMSFATVRDVIDENFAELHEAKIALRNHQWDESRRQRQLVEDQKQKRKAEAIQEKEDRLKAAGVGSEVNKDKLPNGTAEPKPTDEFPPEVHLTERQRLAIESKKEEEDRQKQKKEDIIRSQAEETERMLAEKVSDIVGKSGRTFLGRDRAFRRYWLTESVPGLYVEHDDDNVGECLAEGTPWEPESKPMDEETAMAKVKEIMEAKALAEQSSSSDKENEDKPKPDIKELENTTKTYSKKTNEKNAAVLKQKVLSAKNGSLTVEQSETATHGQETPSSAIKVKSENGEVEEMKVEVETKASGGEVGGRPWGLCSADAESCVVHSTILPRTYWSYYSTVEEIDSLIGSLNDRGVRESELKEKLMIERDRLSKSVKRLSTGPGQIKEKITKTDVKEESMEEEAKGSSDPEGSNKDTSISAIVDLTLRDQILEMEEKIFIGNLGTLKCRNRSAWQEAIKDGRYDSQCDGLHWGGSAKLSSTDAFTPFESRLASAEPSRPASPNNGSFNGGGGSKRDSGGSDVSVEQRMSRRNLKKIRDLASAILQVAQMLDEKYLKPPLGEDEKSKKKRVKEEEKRRAKQQEEAEARAAENENDDEVSCLDETVSEPINTPLQDWETSLMGSTNAAQLFIHLTTLESSVIWSKSLLNTKCRICRRKSDPEKMLLCDSCDRGHHMYCLKPKVKAIPEGEWYCNDCKPKMRIRSPKKNRRSRQVFEDESERMTAMMTDNHDKSEEENESGSEDEAENENAGAGSEDEGEGSEEDGETGAADGDGGDDSDQEENENSDDEDSPLRRRKKPLRDPPTTKKATKRKTKKEIAAEEAAAAKAEKSSKKSKKAGGLSQLLGQRRCATEANERIARCQQAEAATGNSTNNDAAVAAAMAAEPSSARLRDRRAKSQATLAAGQATPPHAAAQAPAPNKDSGARSKRRRAVDEDLDSMFNPTVLEDLLNTMMRHRDGWPFDRPITKADAPDYHKIVTRAMDLGTIRSSINRMKYTCNQEVIEDINLVFANCWLYNRTDAEEYQCGLRLEKYFLKEGKKAGLLGAHEKSKAPHLQGNSHATDEDEDSAEPPPKRGRRTF